MGGGSASGFSFSLSRRLATQLGQTLRDEIKAENAHATGGVVQRVDRVHEELRTKLAEQANRIDLLEQVGHYRLDYSRLDYYRVGVLYDDDSRDVVLVSSCSI